MNETKGFIKLYRSVLDWEWFNDINTFRLFLYCLLKANYSDTKWRGIDIERGSFITSYQKLANATGLTVQQVRTSLNKLEVTGELTHKSHSKYSVVVINNYEHYQENNTQSNKQTNKQVTTKEQDSNKVVTTDKENKKERKEEKKKKHLDFVYLTNTQLQKLVEKHGKDFVDGFIFQLDEYIAMSGKKYKDHYRTLQNWIRRDPNPKWLNELKKEQEASDNKVYTVSRPEGEIKDIFDKL